MPTICTFNVNNLYVRYRFGKKFPGDRSAEEEILDEDRGYLPFYDPDLMTLFRPEQRELAARAITNDRTELPDIVCLQEVESLIALRRFNEEHLHSAYPYALLVDSRDFRQIDVGILSTLEPGDIRTHVDDLDPTPDDPERPWLFSRDCLEVEIPIGGGRLLSLFINHLKSKYAETPHERVRADNLRHRQADAVKRILHKRFPGSRFNEAYFIVLGDLNDEPLSDPVQPLVADAGLANALERLPVEEERWTHWYRSENSVAQLDYLLLSPALDAATQGVVPRIERRGVSFSRILVDGSTGPRKSEYHRVDGDPNPGEIDFQFDRFPEVGPKIYASDHCPVFLELP